MIDLDEKGIYKYNQNKGVISPSYTCFPNNLAQCWEILNQSENCWSNVNKYHMELHRIPDKLTYFMRFENMITEMYKFYYPTEYNTWVNDKTKDKWLYSDNSYPPNEIFKIICIGFNLFLNMNKGDDFKPKCYTANLTINDIKKELDKKKPVVCSFKLDDLSHIITVKGYTDDSFLIYDTYGCSKLKLYKDKGNAKIIPFSDFKKLSKLQNEDKKICICFYNV